MGWKDVIFGTRAERRTDRVESRWQALISLIAVTLTGTAAWTSSAYFADFNALTGVLILLTVLGVLFLFQVFAELIFAHTLGAKPILLLLLIVIVLYGVMQAVTFVTGM